MEQIINTIQGNVTRIANEFRNHWRREFNRISDKCAVAVMTWLLSKRSVQHVVADTFNGETPMCRVLRRAVADGAERDIDVDNIEGLGREIENAIENAFSDHNFTDAVKDAIDLEELVESIDLDELAEKVSERVVDELVRKLQR